MKNSHLRKVPSKEHTPLKEGNMDITLSGHDSSRYGHNQAYQGRGKSVLNVNVIFLHSESSSLLLSQINLNESENSTQNLLTFQPRRKSRQPKNLYQDTIKVESDGQNKKEPLVRNRRVHQILKDLNDIEEEEVESENIPDDITQSNRSIHSSDSEVFYSLDGSNCGEETKSSLCASEPKEKDTFYSACSSFSPSIILMQEQQAKHDNADDESQTDDVKEYLTPRWKAKEEIDKIGISLIDDCEDATKNETDNILENNQNKRSQTLLTSKWVALEDSSARLNISRETSLEDCCPEETDEILTGCISAADILIAVYSDDEELGKVLHHSGGVIGYVKKYWTGFFPLLLVHLTQAASCDPVTEVESFLIADQFSFSHRLIIQDISSDCRFLLQSIVRYHLHVHQLQCSRLALVKRGSLIKSLSNAQWKCPGLCRLQTVNPEREQVRAKKKKTFFQSVRRSLTVRRATRREGRKSRNFSAIRNTSSFVDRSLSQDKR